jgi:PGF-pre-PGF domain-containing protein
LLDAGLAMQPEDPLNYLLRLGQLFNMHCRFVVPLAAVAALALILPMVRAADFDALVVPNQSIWAGSAGVMFNLTINNTNQSVNITGVNVSLPQGFVFVSGSNQTSSQALFANDSVNLTWTNQTPEGFIANMSGEWFVFNASVNSTPGDYYINITVLDSQGVTNSTGLLVQLTGCNSSLVLAILSPAGGSEAWGEPIEVRGYIEDVCGNPVEDVLVNWSFSSYSNNYTYEQNQSNQSLGYYNYTWTDTQRLPGWYNITMNASRTGYPDNETLLEDAFHIGYRPGIAWVDADRTGTCPETFHFSAQVTDADNDYNNISVELSMWNQSAQGWEGWQLVNWTWKDQLSADIIHFYHNFSNESWEQGLYSYRFSSVDEFNLSGSLNGSGGFMIYNCSRVVDIRPVPPTPENGSNSSSPDIVINMTFSSYYYNATDCILSYNNGSISNFTGNISKGWCAFNITNQTEGLFNYSVWVHNTYTNDSWNGTWYVGFLFPCIEDWVYGDWGSCTGGWQHRSATDLNSCGTADNRSALSMTCDSGGGGGGGSSADTHLAATKVWSAIRPGIPAVMEIDRSGISATSVAVEVSESVGTCNVIVRGFSSKPAQVEPPAGRVHSYLNITTTANKSRLSRVTVEFSVERSWVESMGIDIPSIRLMRLNGNWTELPTEITGSDNESLSFRAVMPGLSWFAVTGKSAGGDLTGAEPETPREVAREPDQEPGLETPEEVWDVCRPGEHQCAGGLVLQVCNAWGTGWINEETCFYGCRDEGCARTFYIEFDLDQLWTVLAGIMILAALLIIYSKRRAIDDFFFWRF